jgi:integrase
MPRKKPDPPKVLDTPSPPRRPKDVKWNESQRTREWLTEPEVKKLIEAARGIGRHGPRDALMILLAYRHGLRCAEVIDLRWDQVDFDRNVLHVRRLKRGDPSTQPLTRVELTALRKLVGDDRRKGHIFITERKGKAAGPLSESGFFKIVKRAGKKAELGDRVHPHMLRHACGYELANHGHDTRSIQAYLGHRNIQHTVGYTKLAPGRFDGFFKD